MVYKKELKKYISVNSLTLWLSDQKDNEKLRFVFLRMKLVISLSDQEYIFES